MANLISALQDHELDRVAGGRYTGPTFVYVMQPGDKLSILAQRFGTTVRVLQELNNLKDANSIRPGTALLIPQR